MKLPTFTHQENPFAHGVSNSFLPVDMYEELSATFPLCPANSGPTGFSLFADDPEYQKLIRSESSWAALYELTHSQDFVNYCAAEFALTCRVERCKIDLRAGRFCDFVETRKEKEKRSLAPTDHPPLDLFVRTDILQGNVGYGRLPHVDHRRRAVTILIYCCDAMEAELRGGDLLLHAADLWGSVAASIRPAHNRAVGFACGNASLHSVSLIQAQTRPRNFVQISLSSTHDIWPAAGLMSRFKRYFGDRVLP